MIHRIHFGQLEGFETSEEIPPSQKYFRGAHNMPARLPGQNVNFGLQKSDPGLRNAPQGMKKQHMRAEKPCRTLPLGPKVVRTVRPPTDELMW